MKLIILILILAILFKAIEDGFRLRGWKKLSHVFAVLHVMVWFGLFIKGNYVMLFPHEILWVGLFYISARILLFDAVHNISAHLPLFYYGKTTFFWDRFKSNHGGWLLIMGLGLSIGIAIKLLNGIY